MFKFIKNDIDFSHKLDLPHKHEEDYYSHFHSFNEILFFVRGNVNYTVETQMRHLQPGDLVFIPSGLYHYAEVDADAPYERYVLKFPDSVIPEFLREKLYAGSIFYPDFENVAVIFKLLDSYDESYTEDERYVLFISKLLELLIMVCREPNADAPKNKGLVVRIVDYIDKNLGNPITMQTITDEFNYSRQFISSEFKKYMKVPIMQYIRTKKVIAAYHMYLSGVNKNEAAKAFGFENYSTFFRAYKKLEKKAHNGTLE